MSVPGSQPTSPRRPTNGRGSLSGRSPSFPVGDGAQAADEAVTVCVRCKPISPVDGRIGPGQRKIVSVYSDESQICITNPKSGSSGTGASSSSAAAGPSSDKFFTFDAALDAESSQVVRGRIEWRVRI